MRTVGGSYRTQHVVHAITVPGTGTWYRWQAVMPDFANSRNSRESMRRAAGLRLQKTL